MRATWTLFLYLSKIQKWNCASTSTSKLCLLGWMYSITFQNSKTPKIFQPNLWLSSVLHWSTVFHIHVMRWQVTKFRPVKAVICCWKLQKNTCLFKTFLSSSKQYTFKSKKSMSSELWMIWTGGWEKKSLKKSLKKKENRFLLITTQINRLKK